jgi:hypothetical protein
VRLFVVRDGVIRSRLSDFAVAVLRLVPQLLAGVGESAADPAADRLTPQVHPDDPERSEEFRRLAADMIQGTRESDADALAAGLDRIAAGGTLSFEEAAGWVRALAHARVILGARLGIEEDGWEADRAMAVGDTRIGVLQLLGQVQDDLVAVLTSDLM